MGHVGRQPLAGLVVQFLGHTVAGGEVTSQQLVGNLLEVVLHGQVLRAVIGCFPAVAQTQAEHELVGELGFSVARTACYHHEPPQLERAVGVQVLPARFGAALQSVLVEGAQLLAAIIGGGYALYGNFLGLLQADGEAVRAVTNQMLVAVLAAGSVAHYLATFRAQTADEFTAQHFSGGILVYGDVDGFLVLEVTLHEAVYPGEVALRAGGHGDDVAPSGGGHQGAGVELAFGDDGLAGAQYAVDVVGDELGVLHHFEVLLSAAELGVDEGITLEVVEAEAVLFFLALGHPFALFGDAELVEQLLRQRSSVQ